MIKDSLLISLPLIILTATFTHFRTVYEAKWAPFVNVWTFDHLRYMDSLLPIVSQAYYAVYLSFGLSIVMGIMIFYARHVIRHFVGIILVMAVVGSVLVGLSAVNAGEFWVNWSLLMFDAAFTWFIIVFLLRDNFLAYLITGFLATSANMAILWLKQPILSYRLQGVLWIVLIIMMVVSLWRYAKKYLRENATSETDSLTL